MVLNRTWNFKNLHRIMCLALCLGVVCFALAGNAWAGTTRLATGVTVPSTYAQEATITPSKFTVLYTSYQFGNTYKLVNTGSYSSDLYRDLDVAPTADFFVVVNLPANVYFQGATSGSTAAPATYYPCQLASCKLPAFTDITVSGGGGAATFTLIAGGVNGTTYVTYRATITTPFTSAPTLKIEAGTNNWTIRDYSNKMATAGSAGAISASVLTYYTASSNIFDSGSDAIAIMQSSPALMLTQALSPTTAVLDSSTLRTSFAATAPDDATHDNGATMGIGYASPVPLNVSGADFALTAADKVVLSFTSSNNDFSGLVVDPVDNIGLPTYPGTIPGIMWAGIEATYSTGTTKTLTVAGNNSSIGSGVQPLVFTVDGVTTLVTRTLSVKVDVTLAGGGATVGGGAKALLATSTVTQWMLGSGVGEVKLLANWLNGNTTAYNSRIYIYNSTSIPADVTARVIKMPPAGGTPASAEITTPGSPISLGTLSGNSGMSIKLKEDLLNFVLAALPGGALPYTENGGNLMVEVTVHGITSGVTGTCQVFSGSLAFGQVPLVIVP